MRELHDAPAPRRWQRTARAALLLMLAVGSLPWLARESLSLISVAALLLLWGTACVLWVLLGRQIHPDAPAAAETPAQTEGHFLSSMGHDLRQPAQAIALFAATLSAHPLPDASRKLVSGIESAVQQLSAQLEAVFSIAKLASGRQPCELTPVALGEVFAHNLSRHLDDAHERGLHLRHAGTARSVLADEAMLARALDCLVLHALEVTQKGGVLVGSRRRGQDVCIEVWDSHPGVPLAQRADVFVPGATYGQQLTDRGLGLVLAHRLAQAMGGRLELYSPTAGGAVMRLYLPAA